MKIIDCFLFFNEIDLLKLRLKELNDVVDHFVLVESTKTFSNKQKSLFYDSNKELFTEYHNKITHLVCSKMPANRIWRSRRRSAWKRQEIQRNFLAEGINKISPNNDDLILLSDVDEIPDPRTLLELKDSKFSSLANLEQDLYYYNITCRHEEKWHLALISSYKSLMPHLNSLHRLRIDRSHPSKASIIPRGGWHFSYFGGVDAIMNKIKNLSAHTEIDRPEISNPGKIQKLVSERKDILLRGETFEYIEPNENDYLPLNIDLIKY
jgi:beta-1,4-mannosyl-glycoprotein beta-1,4-N-acetylglucosaminyltransferase